MSAGCVRWMLSHTVRALCGGRLGDWTPASRFIVRCERSPAIAFSWRSPFCTAVDNTEQTAVPKQEKKNPYAWTTITTVPRMIPERKIEVISETGENLGIMHRADVIKIMDERGLKLVMFERSNDAPFYQLMSGKEIYQKQLEMQEKKKAKTPPVQVKEITFSTGIGAHDRSCKLRQMDSWLEKKYHIKVTIRARHGQDAVNLDTTLEKILEDMKMEVGYVSKPKVTQNGRAVKCVLRQLSAKELSTKKKSKAAADVSSSKATHSKTSNVSNTDTTQESTQQ